MALAQGRLAAAPEADELLPIARSVAARAGAILREHFDAPARGVRSKSNPSDLVSAADVAAEGEIRELLRRSRPGDGMLGEEGGETPSRSGLRWVVDPLDGTWNFLHRIPHWSVSVACEDARGPLVGVVLDPLRDECFSAARGLGATLNGEPLSGSEVTDLELATLGGEFSAHTEAEAEAVRSLVSGVGQVRNYGSAALDLAWAAAGRWDAVYHGRFPSDWDVAAGALLCREAGLSFERLEGLDGAQPRLLVAAPAIAAPLRALIEA